MEVIKETLWKRCLSTPTKPPAKNSNIYLSETAYQHKGTRKKCKKTNQCAIIQWQRQCLMYKPHGKPRPKSKTSGISKHSPSPLHHTFLLRRARFNAQPLSALTSRVYYTPVRGDECIALLCSLSRVASASFSFLIFNDVLVSSTLTPPVNRRHFFIHNYFEFTFLHIWAFLTFGLSLYV